MVYAHNAQPQFGFKYNAEVKNNKTQRFHLSTKNYFVWLHRSGSVIKMFIKHYLLHFGPLFYHLVSSSLHQPFPSKIQHSPFSIANLPSRRPCNKTCLQATFQGLSISHHPRLMFTGHHPRPVHRPPSKACPQATIPRLVYRPPSKDCPQATIPRLVHRPPSKDCPQATIPGLFHRPPSKACPQATIPRLVQRPPFQGLSAGHHPRFVHKPPSSRGLSTGHQPKKGCPQHISTD